MRTPPPSRGRPARTPPPSRGRGTWPATHSRPFRQARAAALEDQLGRPVRIGCLGLAFKPDVDDLRESPALHITTELVVAGLEVLACEPNLHDHPTIKLHTLEQVLADADLLVFLVAHSPFRSLDLSGRTVFDLCGVTDQDGPL